MNSKPFQMLWSMAVVLGVLSLFSVGDLSASENPRGGSPTGETFTLKIEGWTCASCEKDVQAALMSVSGVQSATVSYASGGAIVMVEPGKVTPDQLVQAIHSASNVFDSYQARVIPNGTLSIEKKVGVFDNIWSSIFQ